MDTGIAAAAEKSFTYHDKATGRILKTSSYNEEDALPPQNLVAKVGRLNDTATKLEEVVNVLESRLALILKSGNPREKIGLDLDSGTELSARIDSISQSVIGSVDRIVRMCDNLDI